MATTPSSGSQKTMSPYGERVNNINDAASSMSRTGDILTPPIEMSTFRPKTLDSAPVPTVDFPRAQI